MTSQSECSVLLEESELTDKLSSEPLKDKIEQDSGVTKQVPIHEVCTKTEEHCTYDEKHDNMDPDPPLSKKQRKRLIKQQKYEEIKKMRTIKRKEKRKLKKEQREQEENHEVKPSSDMIPIIKYRTMDSPQASPLKVAIDLSFDNLMSDKDISKLTKQLQRCYALNRRSLHPLQLYFTSFGDKCKQRFDNELKGHYLSWDVHIKSEYITDVFPKEDIVYLSSDSANVLNDFDMAKTYVIGGLVDHNHQKGLCYNIAEEKGINHAQLPISEYFKLTTRTVMTVNQVYEIIMYYMENKDWCDAFTKVMPQRKITPKVRRKRKQKIENEHENTDVTDFSEEVQE